VRECLRVVAVSEKVAGDVCDDHTNFHFCEQCEHMSVDIIDYLCGRFKAVCTT
jgi:hypothetical protein